MGTNTKKATKPAAGGFRRASKTLRLAFSGELEGLEVVVRPTSPDVLRQVVTLAETAQDAPLTQQATAILDLASAFGQLLVSWNYQDEQGAPIPATGEALAAEDSAFVLAVVYAWMDALSVRAEQLNQSAVDEAELPMEVG